MVKRRRQGEKELRSENRGSATAATIGDTAKIGPSSQWARPGGKGRGRGRGRHVLSAAQRDSAAGGAVVKTSNHSKQLGSFPSPQQIQWNKQLVECRSPQEVLQLTQKHLSGFNLVNCTTALQRLAKTSFDGRHAVRPGDVEFLVKRTVEHVQAAGRKCPPQNLANALWACGRLGVSAGAGDSQAQHLIEAAKDAVEDPSRMNQFRGQHLANIAWAVAKLGGPAASNFAPFSAAIGTYAQQLNAQELSMAAWALATCGESAGLEEIVSAAKSLSGGGVKTMDAQQLATLAWSLAKLGVGDKLLFEEIAEAALRDSSLRSFKAHDLASLAWAFGRRGVKAPALFEAVGAAVRQRLAHSSNKGDCFSPKHLAMVLWAFAKVKARSEETAQAITNAAERRLTELAPRDLTDIVWAVEALRVPGVDSFVQAATNAAKSRSNEFNSQELLKLLGALRRGGAKDDVKALATTQRELVYEFPALDLCPQITLIAGAPGASARADGGGDPQRRDGRATGTAIWEASHVLAEWLSRQGRCLSALATDRSCPIATLVPLSWASKAKRRCLTGVELGAGLGLPSTVAAHLGFDMIATDGDHAVLTLLQQNAARNAPSAPSSKPRKRVGRVGSLKVQELLWGQGVTHAHLGLEAPPDLLLAADVVYASAKQDLTNDLVATMSALCGPETLLLVANVRRFPVQHPKGEGRFFARLESLFDRVELPQHCLHKGFQRTGVGSCAVHALRRRADSQAQGLPETPTSKETVAERTTASSAGRGLKRKRRRVLDGEGPAAQSVEASASAPLREASRPIKKRRARSSGSPDVERGNSKDGTPKAEAKAKPLAVDIQPRLCLKGKRKAKRDLKRTRRVAPIDIASQ